MRTVHPQCGTPLRWLASIVSLALLTASSSAMPPKPWEGADKPTPYTVVNTNTGVPMTALPLSGWKAQGPDIGFTLYHSPDAPGFAHYGLYGKYGWGHSYSASLFGTSNGWTLLQADGPSKAFTSADGAAFTEEAGYYDTLAQTYGTIYYANIEMTLAGKDGVRYIFADREITADDPIARGADSSEELATGPTRTMVRSCLSGASSIAMGTPLPSLTATTAGWRA